MSSWTCALQLDADRKVIAGSNDAVCGAIRRGADLRISLASIHNEHIDPASDNNDLIREMLSCPVTYLVDDCWSAGIMSDRVPIAPPGGFGPRMSMSFFMFNQDGRQAIARPHLDGPPPDGQPGPSPTSGDDPNLQPKYHLFDRSDTDTNAPSQNFMYEFEYYRFHVCDCWEELLSHDVGGEVLSGSLDALAQAVYENSCDVKVGIRGLCNDLVVDGAPPSPAPGTLEHEVFVHLGSCYHYTDGKLLLGPSRTVVRVAPAIPLTYRSQAWDFGFAMPRTDGFIALWLCDPYTLKFRRRDGQFAIRWFVRR